MLKEQFVRKLSQEEVTMYLTERQDFVSKCHRVLPRIEDKKARYPNWKAICPKSGCELTLDIIKEELMAYLEEAEEEIKQLERALKPKDKQLELPL